ncbi:MAG: hypothetical protein IJC88_05760 [Oscillospiraceae bacterium]|nr:hypothetical protein [Oscillospiraceae bacterium]
MKRLIALTLTLVVTLCGCSFDLDDLTKYLPFGNNSVPLIEPIETVPETPSEPVVDVTPEPQPEVSAPDYTGLWEHKEYPDPYGIVIYEASDTHLSFDITAVRGNYSQIATCKVENAPINGNTVNFSFTDSFGNAGTGSLVFSGNEMTVTYHTFERLLDGNWGIDAGSGRYTKTKEMAEMPNYNPDDYESFSSDDFATYEDTPSTITWPATNGIKTYLPGNSNVVVYESPTSTKKYGEIFTTDVVTICGHDAASNRLIVNYPIAGGKTKTGYIDAEKIISCDFNVAVDVWEATHQITTYTRFDGKTEFGYISPGDTVYTLDVWAGYKQVIYPVSGGYKLAWILE